MAEDRPITSSGNVNTIFVDLPVDARLDPQVPRRFTINSRPDDQGQPRPYSVVIIRGLEDPGPVQVGDHWEWRIWEAFSISIE
jgi:hypothetical protein